MCDQHFRQVPKPLGSPGVPWLDSYKASSVCVGGGHQRLRWELEPASSQHTEQGNSITS